MLDKIIATTWLRLRQLHDERGAEIVEVLFWIGVGLLAVLILVPQVRAILVDKMNALIQALSQ